ncbi:PilW family protein [Aeromonas sp. 164P]
MRRQAGVGLIEVMISLVLGLFIAGVIIQVFLGNHRTYLVSETLARVQENSRFATGLLERELRPATYMGCLSKQGVPIFNTLNSTALPYDFSVGLRGGDNISAVPTFAASLFNGSEPTPKINTDVLLVQGTVGNGVPVVKNNNGAQLFAQLLSTRPNYCVPGQSGYSDLCEGDVVMVSDCQKARVFQITNLTTAGGELNVVHSADKKYTPGNKINNWGGASGNGGSTPAEEIFGAGAMIHRLETKMYYIARANNTQDWGLYRKINAQPGELLIKGVMDLQLTYGEDLNQDRAVDRYVAANNVTDWSDVVGIGFALLLRSEQGGVVTKPQAISFAGATFQSSDLHWYRSVESTVALRNRLP